MNKLKSSFWICLFGLLGLALYQIVLIFWDAPQQQESSRWYSMAQPDTEANMLKPGEIYFTLGGSDGSYGRVTKQEADYEDIFLNAYELLAYVLQNGDIEEESFELLPWQQEACVMTYSFALGNDLVMQQVGLKEKLPEGSWSEIWVLPAQKRQDKVCVYLLDQAEQICLKATWQAWDLDANQQLLVLLRQQESLLSKNYLAVQKGWPERRLQGNYILENSIHETAHMVNAKVIFLLGKKMNPVQAEQYALRFFQYPDTVTVKESASQILFTNEKITVKLDETGLVQYVETLTDEEKNPITMREAYQLAVGFVKSDLDLDENRNVDFIFAAYEAAEDQYVFYFNYVICGVPYQMQEERVEQWRMEHPIRVTVEGSRVRRYERFALDFDVKADSQYTLKYTWQEMMNEMAGKGTQLQGVPELRFYLEGSRMILYWEAETKTEKSLIKAY